jgi:hypothetical protein
VLDDDFAALMGPFGNSGTAVRNSGVTLHDGEEHRIATRGSPERRTLRGSRSAPCTMDGGESSIRGDSTAASSSTSRWRSSSASLAAVGVLSSPSSSSSSTALAKSSDGDGHDATRSDVSLRLQLPQRRNDDDERSQDIQSRAARHGGRCHGVAVVTP